MKGETITSFNTNRLIQSYLIILCDLGLPPHYSLLGPPDFDFLFSSFMSHSHPATSHPRHFFNVSLMFNVRTADRQNLIRYVHIHTPCQGR